MAILQGYSSSVKKPKGVINSIIYISDYRVIVNQQVTLTVTVNGDPVGHTFTWQQISGPSVAYTTSETTVPPGTVGDNIFNLTFIQPDNKTRVFKFCIDAGSATEQCVNITVDGFTGERIYYYTRDNQSITTSLEVDPVPCNSIQGTITTTYVKPTFTPGIEQFIQDGYTYWTFDLTWDLPGNPIKDPYITQFDVYRVPGLVKTLTPTEPRVYSTDRNYKGIILRDNPVGYWKLDEQTGSIAYDSSGNGFNGTYQGSITKGHPSLLPYYTKGYSSAFYVSGDQIVIPYDPALNILGDITIEAWVKLFSGSSGLRYIVTFGATGETPDTNFIYNVRVDNSGHLGAFHESGNGSNRYVDTGIILNQNVTYHVVVVRDSTALVYKFYVNGELVYTGSYASNPTGGTSGQLYIGGSPYSNNWEGYLDEVAIYNYQLTEQQIKQHYEAGAIDPLVTYNIVTSYNINGVEKQATSCDKDFSGLNSDVVDPILYGAQSQIHSSATQNLSLKRYTISRNVETEPSQSSAKIGLSTFYYDIIQETQLDQINTSARISLSTTYSNIITP